MNSNLPVDEFALSEVRYLVSEGKKLEAIAKYREMTGVGLAEAKEAIESLAVNRTLNKQGLLKDVADDIAEKIKTLVAQGNKIEAIKVYREATSADLREAKDAVEAVAAGGAVSLMDRSAKPDGGSMEKIDMLLQQGNKIEAIKVYREATGADLKQAKDAIDAIKRERGW